MSATDPAAERAEAERRRLKRRVRRLTGERDEALSRADLAEAQADALRADLAAVVLAPGTQHARAVKDRVYQGAPAGPPPSTRQRGGADLYPAVWPHAFEPTGPLDGSDGYASDAGTCRHCGYGRGAHTAAEAGGTP